VSCGLICVSIGDGCRFGVFNPTAYVDISDALDKKIEALMSHVSQAEASEKVSASWVRSSAEHYGFLCRRTFAEGFEPARLVVDY